MFIYSRSQNLFAFPNGKEGIWEERSLWIDGVGQGAAWQLPAAFKEGKTEICGIGQNLGSDDGSVRNSFVFV